MTYTPIHRIRRLLPLLLVGMAILLYPTALFASEQITTVANQHSVPPTLLAAIMKNATPAKDINQTATALKLAITQLNNSCTITTEAGVKAVIYAYHLEARRINEAITDSGCTDYTTLWNAARQSFSAQPCPCAAYTCGTYSGFTENICLDEESPLGTVYTGALITLKKLEEVKDEPGTYLDKVYTDYIGFGGDNPNASFGALDDAAPFADMTGGRGIFGDNTIRIHAPTPQIKIPGLIFSSIADNNLVKEGPDGEQILVIPFLGEYIAAIFRYAIGIGTILAGIVILVSGIQMMSPGNIVTSGSGDQKTTVNQAKQRIQTALVGLLLALFSYTILFTINPDLIRFRNLEVTIIPGVPMGEGNDLVGNHADEVVPGRASSPVAVNPSNLGYGFNSIPYFAQGGGNWGNQVYGNNCTITNLQGQTVPATYKATACGPTSFAMVLHYYEHDVYPHIIGNIAVRTGARVCGQGTSLKAEYVEEIKQQFNVNIESISVNDIERVIALLNQGKPIIQSGKHIGYTSTGNIKPWKNGHYIVYTGIEEVQGTTIVRVNDPGQSSSSRGLAYKTMEQFRSRHITIAEEQYQNNTMPFLYIHPRE